MKKVTILGCGPSGLLAAHAYTREGWNVTILSKKKPSIIGGAQYLHIQIPGITGQDPEGIAYYIKIGTRDGYAEKVYGQRDAPVSWDLYDEGPVGIWSLRGIYERLWEKFEDQIHNTDIDAHFVQELSRTGHVVSSIPASLLCVKGCTFHFQKVFIFQKPDNRASIPENFIQYNGNPEHLHYRRSRIFGIDSWEYSSPSVQESEGVIPVRKPLSTNCQCQPNVVRVGRYGRWEKAALAHHAFEQSLELARAM